MAGGTEAFPDLGKHCQHDECHQLDFLPFTCDGCRKVFCKEHISYKLHKCPNSDRNSRKVVVCETCSTSIEITGLNGEEDEKVVFEKHRSSQDCDSKKRKKPVCPVKRCKEILTFSNTSTCKNCQSKVCLKHRFPVDHGCNRKLSTADLNNGGKNEKFLVALALRNARDCGQKSRPSGSTPKTNHSVEAC